MNYHDALFAACLAADRRPPTLRPLALAIAVALYGGEA